MSGTPVRHNVLLHATEWGEALDLLHPLDVSPDLEAVREACAHRLAAVATLVRIHRQEVEQGPARVEFFIQHAAGEDPANRLDVHINATITINDPGCLAALHAALVEMKAFLDVYAMLLAKLIVRGKSMGFSKASVDGSELAGGKFIAWLKHRDTRDFPNRELLRELIEEQSRAWVTELVRYRDQATHNTAIQGYVPLKVEANEGTGLDPTTYRGPLMPNGMHAAAYVGGTEIALRTFVARTLALFPQRPTEPTRAIEVK